MPTTDMHQFLQTYLAASPNNSPTTLTFLSSITLAYRNLYEQSDTGTILSPVDFVALLITGSKLLQFEAQSSLLMKLIPNPSKVDPSKLIDDFIEIATKTLLDQTLEKDKFTDLVSKLILTKGAPL